MKLLNNLALFYNFLFTYNKNYTFDGYTAFMENINFIDQINMKNPMNTYKLAINEYTDINSTEFSNKHFGLFKPNHDFYGLDTRCTLFENNSNIIIPEEFDWRFFNKNIITPVKNQKNCGSCWAFACTETAESVYALEHNELVVLSPQELVDCVTDNKGCSGGLIDNTLTYIIDHGLEKNINDPYESKEDKCKEKDTKYKPKACFYVEPNNELEMKRALLTVGPLVGTIQADSKVFQLYDSGVIVSETCGTEPDHAIQIVGYGVDELTKIPYWTIRNSWGHKWGENGYVRIERTDKKNTPGVCGIARGVSGFYI